jgi:hypothetical protein
MGNAGDIFEDFGCIPVVSSFNNAPFRGGLGAGKVSNLNVWDG